MQDVAAPLYASVLVEAARRLGPSPAYYALWPSADLAHPWSQLAARVYKEVPASPSEHAEVDCPCDLGYRYR